MYTIITRLFGLATDLFYRREHLGGEVPAGGPLILVANHPNSLVDPVIVTRVAGRRVRFLGKAPLFDMPMIGLLVRGMHVLPVYRRVDGATGGENTATFAAVHAALARGEAISLFPEGVSHHEPEIQPLRTGAARMALGAEAEHDFDLGVRIVPIGITYRDKERYRSWVGTRIGGAIDVGRFEHAYREDARDAVRALTEVVDDALREVTVNLDAWEDLPLIEMAEKIWRPGEGERADRIKRLADGARHLRAIVPARMLRLQRWIEGFQGRLEQVGLEADDLAERARAGKAIGFILRNVAALLFGLPAAFAGAIAYAVPYYAVRPVVGLVKPEPDVVATVKLLASVLFFAGWHAAVVTLLTLKLGWQVALPVGIMLPFAGIYSQHFLERREAAWHDLTLFFSLGSRRAARRRLERQRDVIAEEIESLAQVLKESG